MSIEVPAMESLDATHLTEGAPSKRPPRPKRSGLGGVLLRALRVVIMYLLPPVIIVGGVVGAKHLIDTAPQAERRPRERQAVPVEVMTLQRTDASATVRVMGTVMPAQRVVLQPRVSGEVVKVSPQLQPGGQFEAGEFILQIDPVDYELAVRRTQSQIAQAEYDAKVEAGYREIAEREWELLAMHDQASELELELALRRPHLLKTQAAVEAAKAALRSAELDLERTTVRAPFNCMVISEHVDVGAQVSPQTQLATLVGTDEYWIQAAVPIDQLRWIEFPDEAGEGGANAVIRQELGTGVQGEWTGRAVRLLGDLEPRGRMARVLISVADPLCIDLDNGKGLPLLIDAYVTVTIEGKPVEGVIALPRTALREGRQAWVMNTGDELEIRGLEIVWSNQDTVLVRKGIEAGELVVVTDIPAPVVGMALRLLYEEPDASSQPVFPMEPQSADRN
ncbi:MAG: efflux RND transporter periplasmic adaptor subunit [Phycisphaerales bacterium]|nr:efflux RND transporter periplasmic adaptor subunit [Phycisphaerales bacterium]